MTRKAIPNYPRSIVALFVAILTFLIATAVLAQVAGMSRPSGNANEVFAPPGAVAQAQGLERPLHSVGGNVERAPVRRLRMKGHGPVVMDENPPLFLPAVTYHSGGYDLSLAVADVNGDGRPDLLVADYDGSVDVLLGNGDGTFQTVAAYSSGGSAPYSVAVADLNGDGRPDLAVANFNSNTVGVLLGNGDGTF